MAALFTAISAHAQLISNPQQIPVTSQPPVVFVNGYQAGCSNGGSFAGTFGIADQLLQSSGRVSLFFNNCDIPNNQPIEELGNALCNYLSGLRYTTGETVPQVDVVAHSMGGLIVRSCLSGQQTTRRVFTPPATVKIRKALFLATPFFGSVAADLTSDTQSDELRAGSQFLFDLATWNQNRDDMRGIDALAVVSSGGTGVLTGKPGFDDSTVAVTSGSLEWYARGRTRVVPNYCHTTLSGILAVACTNPTLAIARMNDAQHPSARIMLSFLGNTTDWQQIGQAVADTNYLKDHGGVFLQLRDAQDGIVPLNSATNGLNVRSSEIAWSNYVSPGPFDTTVNGNINVHLDAVQAGLTQTFIVPTGGPVINAVLPSFSDAIPRAVAPGSLMSIYGSALAPAGGTSDVFFGTDRITTTYVSPVQINALVPDTATGLVRLEVRGSTGVRGLNVLIEPAVPSLYPTVLNARTFAPLTAASPAHPGQYVTMYATGLGQTEHRADGLDWARQQPMVSVSGKSCQVTFAGRAPGFPGLDQINCRIADDAPTSATAQVVLSSGSRSSTTVVPVLP